MHANAPAKTVHCSHAHLCVCMLHLCICLCSLLHPLPPANTKITAGQPLTVLGWGATSEGGNNAASLMTVDVAATDLASCNKAYDNGINGDSQICAGVPEGGKDACQGDSGGPLIIRGNTAVEDVQVIKGRGVQPRSPGEWCALGCAWGESAGFSRVQPGCCVHCCCWLAPGCPASHGPPAGQHLGRPG